VDDTRFQNLRSFVEELDRDRDLKVVDVVVSPRLEVAEIHRRVIAAGGPALLFPRVEGSDFPLVTNLFGTQRRAQAAFGRRPARLIRRAVEVAQSAFPPSLGRVWSVRDLVAAGFKMGARSMATGPVSEVRAASVNLEELPVITSWPEDGGPFLTLPLVYTEDPDGGGHNGKGGGFHHARAVALNRDLPVSVFLGGPPALILAAIAPLPENIPELLLASLLAGARIRRCAGPGPHPLLADADFALTGRVPARVTMPEGPFGDHYGYYSLRHDYPVFQVEHLSHRRDAIYPATVVGKPRQEDFFIGDLLQDLLSPLFPMVMPAVESLWSYGETGYHSLAAAVVQQRYRREAMASAFRILGEGQLSLTKFLLVTDRAVRSVRVFQPLDGHPRLHRSGGESGLEGSAPRSRRPGAGSAEGVRGHRDAARRDRSPAVLRWLSCGGWAELAGGAGRCITPCSASCLCRLASGGAHR